MVQWSINMWRYVWDYLNLVVGVYKRISKAFNIENKCQFICSCYDFLPHGLIENLNKKEFLDGLQTNFDIYTCFWGIYFQRSILAHWKLLGFLLHSLIENFHQTSTVKPFVNGFSYTCNVPFISYKTVLIVILIFRY